MERDGRSGYGKGEKGGTWRGGRKGYGYLGREWDKKGRGKGVR